MGLFKSSWRPPFVYTAFNPSIDSLRLVLLKPCRQRNNEAVHCRLVERAFADRPKYDALSYTWGDDNGRKEQIWVNGKSFRIGNNLWEALRGLRGEPGQTRPRTLWIDAICINQSDLAEKSQQLRFMPQIYANACTVLVWLGSPSPGSAAERQFYEYLDGYRVIKKHKCFPQYAYNNSTDVDDLFLSYLCNVDYWNRLWIIQEVLKAQNLEIHFYGGRLDWDRFIAAIEKQPKLADCVPMRLIEQKRDRYGEACKLENLLKVHKDALCKDPRDKIYGLVGLATDCHGEFPMDYSKSVFEVWKDVVLFKRTYASENPREVVQFAQFTLRLLEKYDGRAIRNSDKIPTPPDLNSNKKLLRTLATPSGRIALLGPTWKDLVSSPTVIERWKSRITKYDDEEDLPTTYEENDRLMQTIYKSKPSFLSRAAAFDRVQSYTIRGSHKLASYPPVLRERPSTNDSTRSSSQDDALEARVFLLDITGISSRLTGIARVGLAPPGTQVGDFICHYSQCEKAIVARVHSEGTSMELIGTAVVAQDCRTAGATAAKATPAVGRKRGSRSEKDLMWGIPEVASDMADIGVDLHVRIGNLYGVLQ